jgi:hypothetical protein
MEYVRQRKTRRPIGVVVALKHGDKIRLGYSLCMVRPSKKSGLLPDKFDKQHGVDLALGRAVGPNACIIVKSGEDGPIHVIEDTDEKSPRLPKLYPQSCEKTLLRIAERAVRIFGDQAVSPALNGWGRSTVK